MKREPAWVAAHELRIAKGSLSDAYFHGKSMEPILREGDIVSLEPVTFAEVRVGDVVTYRDDDRFPTRRVVSRRRGRLSLWCDNWPHLRFHADAADVLGRVNARNRNGERLSVDSDEWRQQTEWALKEYKRIRFQGLRKALARSLFGGDHESATG
ncbi:MAG: S24 family peptidase [Pseudomonadota bacterium]